MTADARKRDKNNFINIILTKIELAKNFHQRVALAITSKSILHHITFKFYIRKRYKELFLYTRLLGNFGSQSQRNLFVKDIVNLIPNLTIESTKGHYQGFVIHLTEETKESLILFLKLISLLAQPKDFELQKTKIYYSYFNKPETSLIPVHLRFTLKQVDLIQYQDLRETLLNIQRKKQVEKTTNNNSTDNNLQSS